VLDSSPRRCPTRRFLRRFSCSFTSRGRDRQPHDHDHRRGFSSPCCDVRQAWCCAMKQRRASGAPPLSKSVTPRHRQCSTHHGGRGRRSLRFASPAAERTLGLKPDSMREESARSVAGEDGDRCGLPHRDAATSGWRLPVELRIERDPDHYVLEIVGSNLSDDPAIRDWRLISATSASASTGRAAAQLAFHDPLTCWQTATCSGSCPPRRGAAQRAGIT